MKRLVGKRVAIIGAGSCGEGVGNGKAMAILFAKQGGKILCIDAVSYTHLTLPTTPYV